MVLAGLLGLMFGGDLLVRGAVAVAQRAGIPPMVIGLTLVGFGTSTPELVTSLQAAFAGAPGIAIGNVLGSNIANVLLILGTAAILAPIRVDRRALCRDGAFLVVATLLCVGLAFSGSFGRPAGAVLVLGLVAFLVAALRLTPRTDAGETVDVVTDRPALAVGWFLIGLVLTLAGARFLVDGAVGIATLMGVSDVVIGLTIVAVGTSLPELVTSVAAARRGHAEVAFGNVLGSNVFNILGILGITALVHPLPVPQQVLQVDIWVMALSSALLLLTAATGQGVSRREGIALLALYIAYWAWLGFGAS
ncbi:MAG: calcium/sodium antiporter [Rhodobacteraceae bacterium]|nr:calcium/sodium antiporter [Paracoccaceae bacterium]